MVVNIAYDQPSSQIEKRMSFLKYFFSFRSNLYTQAIDDITHDQEFKDLFKFQLSNKDWKLLEDYQEILQVNVCLFLDLIF